jgi:hypothetical protein
MARNEGMTDQIAIDLKECGKEVLTDERAFHWMYNGGEL